MLYPNEMHISYKKTSHLRSFVYIIYTFLGFLFKQDYIKKHVMMNIIRKCFMCNGSLMALNKTSMKTQDPFTCKIVPYEWLFTCMLVHILRVQSVIYHLTTSTRRLEKICRLSFPPFRLLNKIDI